MKIRSTSDRQRLEAFPLIVLIVGAKLPGVTYEATGGERVTTAVKTAELYSVMTSFFYEGTSLEFGMYDFILFCIQ